MCKRIITIIIAICLIASLALSASAFTMNWDLSKSQQSINNAVGELAQEVENEYPTWADYFDQLIRRYWIFG